MTTDDHNHTAAEKFDASLRERWASDPDRHSNGTHFYGTACEVYMQEHALHWGRDLSGFAPDDMKMLGRWIAQCVEGRTPAIDSDAAARARALLDNATPGPWGPTCYRGTGLGWDVDGPEAGIRGQFENESDAELIAAAPALITDLLAERDAAVARADTATIVAEHWRDAVMGFDQQLRWAAHPLAMVLAALDGETDPAMLGIDPESDAATLLDRGTDR